MLNKAEQHDKNHPLALLLKQLRKNRGYKQSKLAEISDALQQHISQWEHRVLPEMKNLKKIAAHLCVTDDEKYQVLAARYPALDPKWLTQQPKIEHAGLVLDAIRHVFDIENLHDISRALHQRPQVLSDINQGKEAIDSNLEEQLTSFMADKHSDFWNVAFKGGLEHYFHQACEQSRNVEQSIAYDDWKTPSPQISDAYFTVYVGIGIKPTLT